MARGNQRSAVGRCLFFSYLLVAVASFAGAQPASAACYRLLQPGGWGYQTVCTGSGGGGGGGRGFNYGAALGAGAAFLGALQDLSNQGDGGSSSQPSCRAGYRELGGGCAPAGAVDCGGGRYCPSGYACIAGNKCRPAEDVEFDRKVRRDWANALKDKQAAAIAELDDIKRRLAQPQMHVSESVNAALPPKQANPFTRRLWNGTKEDCETAGRLERGTAAWFNVCGPDAGKKKKAAYTPSIDPQQLTLRAKAGCGNLAGEDLRACVMKNKIAILLQEDPAVKAKCRLLTGNVLVRCVDFTYLYGPQGPSLDERREMMDVALASARDREPDPVKPYGPVSASAPPSECGPGFGMKPTQGAFGEWSCQRLGVLFLAPDRQTPIDAGSPEAVESVREFEERVNAAAAAAAVSASKDVGDDLSDADRKACAAASYAAARGALKGGAPNVPDKCRTMALAAQAALAYYADGHVDASNAGLDDLLAAYIEGANAAAVDEKRQPIVGLEPTKEMRRQADCIVRGQGADCAGTPGAAPPPSSPAGSADVCASAELHWKSAESIRTLAVYEDHLTRFPTCVFATLAAARIEQLRKN